MEKQTPIERELIKHGFESWEVSVPSGDRRVDHFVKQELSKIIKVF